MTRIPTPVRVCVCVCVCVWHPRQLVFGYVNNPSQSQLCLAVLAYRGWVICLRLTLLCCLLASSFVGNDVSSPHHPRVFVFVSAVCVCVFLAIRALRHFVPDNEMGE